jgi:hypothetical protein
MKITFSHINGKRYAYFVFGSREDYDASLLPGNELRISKGEWNSKGVVVKITGSNYLPIQMRKCVSNCSITSPPQKRTIPIRWSLCGSLPHTTA